MRGSGEVRQSGRDRRAPGVAAVAVALAIGIAAGESTAPLLWPWLGGAAAAAMAAGAAGLRRRPLAARWLLVAAFGLLGAAWLSVRQHHAPDDALVRWQRDGAPLRVEGTVLDRPRRHRPCGAMARFAHGTASASLTLRLEALVDAAGARTRASGRLRLWVEGEPPRVGPGDAVEVIGILRQPVGPMNPGVFDGAAAARRRGVIGMLAVSSPELIRRRSTAMTGTGRLMALRARLQDRALAGLLEALPADAPSGTRALLAAILLGRRDLDFDGADGAFRRVGVAHLLAISGLHLGVLAGVALLALRWTGRRRRWHGLLLIAVVLGYVLLVEPRMSVLRAAVMTITASLGLVTGRRLEVRGLVGLSAMALLLWRPAELFSAGFQLSYAVVIGLVVLAPRVRERLDRDRLPSLSPGRASSLRAMAARRVRTAAVVALVAWLVATPLTIRHFGLLSPLGAPLGAVLIPAVALLLAGGYVTLVAALVAPPLAAFPGAALGWWAGALIRVVEAIDGVPGSSLHLPRPPAWWAAAALAAVALWAGGRDRRRGLVLGPAAAGLAAWLLWPWLVELHPAWRAALRVDALAVGAGSCYVVRSGGSTVLFDAGSRSSASVGERVVVPALRALGVRSVDAVVVSHPNFDHYSAVPEIVERMPGPARVIVTRSFIDQARGDPAGPAAWLLGFLECRGVAVEVAAAGHVETFGAARWHWLHPRDDETQRGEAPQRVNDGSMVVRVEAAGRALLLTGDIERRAIARLLRDAEGDAQSLRADVMELPHHGAHGAASEALVRQVDPLVILQSAGWTRWRRDAWRGSDVLAGRRRLVTARDGALTVRIDHDGSIETRTWVDGQRGARWSPVSDRCTAGRCP